MNSPAEDVKDMLDDTSTGAAVGTFATDLFCHRQPDAPDACLTIYDTGGYPPDPDAALGLEYPTIQVRARGPKGGASAARAKLVEARAALHGSHEVTWNGARYLWIFAQGEPILAGFDEQDRPAYTQNYRLARTPAA